MATLDCCFFDERLESSSDYDYDAYRVGHFISSIFVLFSYVGIKSWRVIGMNRRPNKGASANRRYASQLDDFMKFDCQDCILESRSAAVAELRR